MAKFRKIYTTIWNDEKFSNLSDQAQLIFFFLLTHPNTTWLGFIRTNIAGIAAEKEWDIEKTKLAFDELAKEKMVLVDSRKPLIFITNWLKYNPPQNPNMAKSYKEDLYQIPECELKNTLLKICKENLSKCSKAIQQVLPNQLSTLTQTKDENAFDFDTPVDKKTGFSQNVDNSTKETVSETVPDTVSEPFRNGIGNIKTLDIDLDIDPASASILKTLEGISLVGRNNFSNAEVVKMKKIIFDWNVVAKEKKLRPVSTKVNLNSERGRKLVRQIRTPDWKPFEALKKLSQSDFLLGRVKNSEWYGQGASFDWFLKPDSVEKILEGAYDTPLSPRARRRKALGLNENGKKL